MHIVFTKIHRNNICTSCVEDITTIMHNAGLPALDDLSWQVGHWVPEVLIKKMFCPHRKNILLFTEGEGTIHGL